tara:strand:- start:123 stop:1010 length:888 start_codon:yes stop_codon:yes gene_type:complete
MEKLVFDKNRKRIKHCPCCGHENKTGGYVPYIGTEAGYCNYCGSSCFPDRNGTLVSPKELKFIKPLRLKKSASYIPNDWHENSLKNYDNNDFTTFLLGQFKRDLTREIICRYRLGTKDNNVVFWQIDIDKKIRTGKIMDYNPTTGKRGNYYQWVHQNKKDFNLKQCFFGEHLIIKDKPIAVVESEKTACIMSVCNPSFIWLACGGSNGITEEKVKILIGRDNVVLFPDEGKYKHWKEIAHKYTFAISKECEMWYEKGQIAKGDDIADRYLNIASTIKIEKFDPEWNQEEYDSAFK